MTLISNSMEHLLLSFGDFKIYILLSLGLIISCLAGLLTHFVLYKILSKFISTDTLMGVLFKYLRNPLHLIFFLFYMTLVTDLLDYDEIAEVMSHIVKILIILAITWSVFKLIDYLDVLIVRKSQFSSENLHSAQKITKFHLLKNIVQILVMICGISLLLLSFESVKEIGKGLLLSAGVKGAILAFGAQKLVGNIILGFQLAFTKSIRIGDTLRIDGELGNVEDISFTHMTLCLWDLRRLVIPLTYFIDKPFINFTQPSPNLLGPILFNVDYNINIDSLRQFLFDILEETPLWDKQVGKLEVVDLSEN